MSLGMNMAGSSFAVSANGFRAIDEGAAVHTGEAAGSSVPDSVLNAIEADSCRRDRNAMLRASD